MTDQDVQPVDLHRLKVNRDQTPYVHLQESMMASKEYVEASLRFLGIVRNRPSISADRGAQL